MTRRLAPAYFVPDGDGGFVPTAMAKGPWGDTISGNFVGGLLGLVIERDAGSADLQPARLTVDLLRPVAMAPLDVRTKVLREGRRLKLVDADMVQSDVVVARASALLLRKGEQPPGVVWTAPITMPPLPAEHADEPPAVPMLIWAYGKDATLSGRSFDLSQWQHDGPKFVWVRDLKPLVDGVPTTPFTRAAMAGDVASSLTHFGTEGLFHINADFTITLSRLPEGTDIGLAALTYSGHNGVGTGTAAVFDRRGQIGSATATTLVNPGFTPPTMD